MIAFFIYQLFDQTQVQVATGLCLHQIQVLVFPFVQLTNDLQQLGIELGIGFSFHGYILKLGKPMLIIFKDKN